MELWLPAEFGADFFRGGDEAWRVAGAAGFLDGFDVAAGDFFAGLDDFADGGAAAGAEVVEITLGGIEREDVGLREVEDVDVVADAGAVGGLVVGAVDFDMILLAEGDFEDVGDQVGFDPVILAKFLRCPGGVEVAERGEGQAVDFFIPTEHGLEHELRLAVGVDRALGEGFVERHAVGNAEGRAGGGEDEFFDAGLHGHVEEVDAAGDIVAEVFRGIGHRLADEGVRGEVHDGFGFRLLEGVAENGAVGEVALVEVRARVDGLGVAFAEIVEYRDLVAAIEKFLDADAADVARAASDQDFFHFRVKRSPAPCGGQSLPLPVSAGCGGRSRCSEAARNSAS